MEDTNRKARILVVDDEEDICEILQYNLERAGYSVKTSLSAEEALSQIASQKYDLLLLDIMLGGISGLKLAQVLREDYRNNIPIIFVTALDTEDDKTIREALMRVVPTFRHPEEEDRETSSRLEET